MNNIANSFNIAPRGALILWGITLLIFFIFVVVFVIKLSHSIQDAATNNGRINQYLAAIPADRIGTINAIYMNSKKNIAEALILCIVGGVFGFQRIYLGKRKSAMAMLLFFWTCIPTIISLFDLVNMPRTVSEFNLSVIESLYNQIAAPKTEN